jgi:hypothetical protein
MLLVFILFSFLSLFLAFFDFSSLRTHFWPLPFPSENFGGHGKKVLRETADPPSPKLAPARKATARGYAEGSFAFTMMLAT